MASDASVALGAPQVAGAYVTPKGLARRATGAAVGGIVGAAIASKTGPKQEGLPDFGRVGYLAASDSEIALVKTKSGLIKMKVTEQALARRPRADIAALTLKGGALSPALTVQFTDGEEWTFDVAKANNRGARQLVESIGGTLL